MAEKTESSRLDFAVVGIGRAFLIAAWSLVEVVIALNECRSIVGNGVDYTTVEGIRAIAIVSVRWALSVCLSL